MPRHGVVLVEDDEPTRTRLARVIEAHPELELLASLGGFEDARGLLEREPPEVLLTDLDLPDGNGLDLLRLLRGRGAATQCMVITVFGDERHVVEAIEAGALGYLLKDGSPDYVGRSILEMLAGGSPMSPPVARYLLSRFTARASPPAGGEADPLLSAREREVLSLIVKGFSYAEIARLMELSSHTVATYVRRIYGKLEVHSRGEAVYEALATGLVKMDE
jgi:DNA-binding NarL/FixJ family response regulator